jgi:hypothetical protein
MGFRIQAYADTLVRTPLMCANIKMKNKINTGARQWGSSLRMF